MRLLRRRKEKQKRERWSADLQVDEAQIRELKHYAYEYWRQVITVDDQGNADHRVEARIINIGDTQLDRVAVPVYCDAVNVPAAAVKPWANCGRALLPTSVEDWITERSRGRVAISIVPPLAPGERRKIRWGYTLPHTFIPGDEYYNWDIATPHYEVGGRIMFPETWTIQYARWDSDIANTQPSPEVKGATIDWIVHFPERGKRFTMHFGLSKINIVANNH